MKTHAKGIGDVGFTVCGRSGVEIGEIEETTCFDCLHGLTRSANPERHSAGVARVRQIEILAGRLTHAQASERARDMGASLPTVLVIGKLSELDSMKPVAFASGAIVGKPWPVPPDKACRKCGAYTTSGFCSSKCAGW